MIATNLLLATSFVLPAQLPSGEGAIAGIVVNASRDHAAVDRAEVVLRVELDGQFVPAAETTTDDEGGFLFESLPIGQEYVYLLGANRDGVHYPGRRIRLSRNQPRSLVRLEVCDSIAEPSPLVARRHEIVVVPKPGSLSVTETILVDNPTSKCYVGRADDEDTEPVTLQLAIPSDFERTTFHTEFFGRRFSLVDGKLVTSIPWQPGRREVKFTYVLPNAEKYRRWERPLDLPCADLRVSVRTDKPNEVSCNLAAEPITQGGAVTYESTGRTLPAGHVLRLELGQLPVPWITSGRWLALAVLVCLITGASILTIRRRQAAERQTSPTDSPPQQAARADAPAQRRKHSDQRDKKRKTSHRRAA